LAATDEQGQFEITYGIPLTAIILNVSPRAMVPKLVTLPTGSEERTVTVTQGATLRGRLLEPDGTPTRNAEIGVFLHNRMAGAVFQELRNETNQIPGEALRASLGCGNPTALAKLNPGETVLDLGSGGGIDVLPSNYGHIRTHLINHLCMKMFGRCLAATPEI
jgi:hypothetical protein